MAPSIHLVMLDGPDEADDRDDEEEDAAGGNAADDWQARHNT